MEWTCRCGAVAVEIDPRGGTRAVCYCGSCRRSSALTDASDALDAYGGSDLYQVAPENARITRGADKLAWVRLTAKGPLRWHTTCCNTPFANTLPTPSVPSPSGCSGAKRQARFLMTAPEARCLSFSLSCRAP